MFLFDRNPITVFHSWVGAVVSLAMCGTLAWSQPPSGEESPQAERIRSLAEPDTAEPKKAKEPEKPPFEFFRSQIAPFDATPYLKPNHWSSLFVEMKANRDAFQGELRTAPVPLLGMPQEVVYRRDLRLVKGQETRLGFQVMVPPSSDPNVVAIPKELDLDLVQPDATRPLMTWPATLMRLGTHQMLITILARQPSSYSPWRRFSAVMPPASPGNEGALTADERLYYRLVLPLDPTKPLLSPHALTWTTTSHVIWDGLEPEALNPSQQRALLDWLHWGGQLVVVGGSGVNLAALQDSFLGPYLPADPTGESIPLDQGALGPLANDHPPPVIDSLPTDSDVSEDFSKTDGSETPAADKVPTPALPVVDPPAGASYRPPVPIRPASNRPVALTGLRPRAGATALPLGTGSPHQLGAEWRVGRGRVTLLGINPTEKVFADWPGIDTFVRRVMLRRPEQPMTSQRGQLAPRMLPGTHLSWLRYLSRDLDAPGADPTGKQEDGLPASPVAAWLDGSGVPSSCRASLEDASGISIPSRAFVLRVLLFYGFALVPLNWCVCRYVLGRREWAWIVTPLLALGTAVAIERAAASEQGFASACDEIDVVELQGDYPRAHLSRFNALYSTGRTRFSVRYPGDPESLALPLNTDGGLRGDERSRSFWTSWPVPSLEGFVVQPRSLAMFRAEQMVDLGGRITWKATPGVPGRVINRSDLELRDAWLVEDGVEPIPLGTIAAGGSVVPGEVHSAESRAAPPSAQWTDTQKFLRRFREYAWDRPEDRGERRLVAWVAGARPRQEISPEVDRRRGLTLVVAHLGFGPPPDPMRPPYAPNAPNRPAREASRP